MSSDRPSSSSSSGSRRLSWVTRYTGIAKDKDREREKDRDKDRDPPLGTLESPPEGVEVVSYSTVPSTHSPDGGGLPFTRSSSSSAISNSPYPSAYTQADRPSAPSRRSSSSVLMTKKELDREASRIILNALERTSSQDATSPPAPTPRSGGFGRKSFSSMMGGFSALSLTRTSTSDDKERGRTRTKEGGKPRSSSVVSNKSVDDAETGTIRARSTSPFFRRKQKSRDPSPSVEALKLSQSDVESEAEGQSNIRPRNAFSQLSATSDEDLADYSEDDANSDETSSDDYDMFDSITEQNTEQNSLVAPQPLEPEPLDAPDPLGEGVNIVVPPEPYFPTTIHYASRNPRRRKSTRHAALPSSTSRPIFTRDRCIITLTHGDPAYALQMSGRRPRRYVVATDLSPESNYALEWGIGTVLRDGDEMILISVNETESKLDPQHPNPTDRVSKLRNQQERQALAYVLARQALELLQRTKLNVTVVCQAWHAKNTRHIILDIVDHYEPTMLIVGSRGLGQLKGILLGSTSHYLVQKCSVPVMVARRRLKRPARRSAHLNTHRARVSLAEAAGVERVTPKVDRDVEELRDQLQRENEREETDAFAAGAEDDEDTEHEDHEDESMGTAPIGQKVAGD